MGPIGGESAVPSEFAGKSIQSRVGLVTSKAQNSAMPLHREGPNGLVVLGTQQLAPKMQPARVAG